MNAPATLRDIVRAEVAARHLVTTANAAQRRALRAEARASEAAADWTNLLTMLEQPGRPVAAATVRKLARAARVSSADLAAVLAHRQVSQ
ncbi:MAG: hypothetical protein Q8S73_24520 [Deltaproteobacteria bacterium]|nr:hypothetical protein [Myxococcales bacterium]MDP3217299.1 hypothetical protein [Deltaproteobacteria bacterium]